MTSELTPVLLGLLIAVLGWIGARVHSKLDELNKRIEDAFEKLNVTVSAIERDLRGDLVNLDRRITKVETRCDSHHGNNQ